MSTAELFVEAVDALTTLGRWAVGWLIVAAVVAAILTLAAIACGAWAVDALLDRLCGCRSGVQAVEAEPEPDDTPHAPHARPRPSWACEQPTDHDNLKEAA